MKKICLFITLLLTAGLSQAQYTLTGTIEYERKVNLHRQMEDNEWMEKFRSQVPKFVTNYFELAFTTDAAYYKPGREGAGAKLPWGGVPGEGNIVYTDFRQKKLTAAKQVFEEQFLIKDSMRKMEWRIDDELRTIAGFKCRKAVGRICDSVYVVAFYTDDIAVNGGPEMFSGLPGMIMEIAIPRLYATWVATKVTLTPVLTSSLTAPAKGKSTTQKELHANLQKTMEAWGAMGARNIWWSVL